MDREEEIKAIKAAAEAEAAVKQAGPIRRLIAVMTWFAVPFLALWSLGVDPVVAAKAAVFPAACMSVAVAIAAAASAVLIWALSSIGRQAEAALEKEKSKTVRIRDILTDGTRTVTREDVH